MNLVHLHIPRSAGSSLEAHLSLACQSAGIGFRAGHFTWGDFEITPDTVVFTVLREPVERALSLYRYILANPDHPKHAGLSADPLGWLKGPGRFTEFNSGQIRQLAGRQTMYRALTAADIETARQNLSHPGVIACTLETVADGLARLSERVCPIPPLDYHINGSELLHIDEEPYWQLVAMQESDLRLYIS